MCLKLVVSHEEKKLNKGICVQGAGEFKAVYDLELIV
jgi:hypothetical protein